MEERLLGRLKRLSMLKYIQLNQELTIETDEGQYKNLPKETILPVVHKNLGKRYYVVDAESLHVMHEGQRFVITGDVKYRWLTQNESMLYQQQVTITSTFNMIPLELPKYINKMKVAKIGAKLYIDGFTYDSIQRMYIPYTEQNEIKYEVDWDNFIPSMVFESLFRQSHNSCLPLLGKQKLLK
jgi:hypothetical protein